MPGGFDIDLVYLWVDGSDPAWLAKKIAFTGGSHAGAEGDNRGRYEDNEELRYSLRSVERYAPWVRRVFIVTDGQTPAWLDPSDPRVCIIDHTEILPPEALPCFNSRVIESRLYLIPGLAEHFLYANDDMMFAGDVQPGFFFAPDGLPIVRLRRGGRLGRWHYRAKYLSKAVMGKRPGSYRTAVHRAASLVAKKTGKYYGSLPHHNIDAYLKSDFAAAVEDVFSDEARVALACRTRSTGDLQRSALLYYALATGRAHARYIDRRESMRIPAQRADLMAPLLRYSPKLLCLNDSQRVTDGDRARIAPFLQELFPEKSGFEK